MLRTAACIASIAAALALAAPAAQAAPPTKSTSSIALAQSTTPSWGDSIRFDVSTTATAEPYVQVVCHQGGALVAEGWAGYFDGALGDGSFSLYSPIWTSGAADCTAKLQAYGNGRWKALASTSFHVDA